MLFKNMSFVLHPLGPYKNTKKQKQLSVWGKRMTSFAFLFVLWDFLNNFPYF